MESGFDNNIKSFRLFILIWVKLFLFSWSIYDCLLLISDCEINRTGSSIHLIWVWILWIWLFRIKFDELKIFCCFSNEILIWCLKCFCYDEIFERSEELILCWVLLMSICWFVWVWLICFSSEIILSSEFLMSRCWFVSVWLISLSSETILSWVCVIWWCWFVSVWLISLSNEIIWSWVLLMSRCCFLSVWLRFD